MRFTGIHRILRSIYRRWSNPEENPMTIRHMTACYIQNKIYLWRHSLPAIQVPFGFAVDAPPVPPRLAVIVHCFYPDLMEEILAHLRHIPFPFALYVSTDTEEKRTDLLRQIARTSIRDAEVRLATNRGRDIGPKYITFRDVYDHCDYFLHLHSKKSPHTGTWGDEWRRYLLHTLAGSPEIVCSNVRLLDDPRIGVVFPVPIEDKIPYLRWGANFDVSSALARRLGIQIRPEFCLDYPSGSMFWGKTSVLRPLLDLGLTFDDMPPEKGQLDGCINHAIERMVIYCACKQGLSGCRVTTRSDYSNLWRAGDERALTGAITSCLAAQEKERLTYDKPGRMSPLRSGP